VGLILEVTEGPLKGKKIEIASERSLTIGRAEGRAQYAIPQDDYMSGVHFSVEVGRGGCKIRDLKSANGTLLNGTALQEGVLVSGDQIRAGKSSFRVSFVADAELLGPARIDAIPPAPPPLPPKFKEEPKPAPSPVRAAKDVPEGTPQRPTPQPRSEPAPPRAPRVPEPPPPVAVKQAPPPPPASPKPAPARPTSRSVVFEVGPWRFSYVPPGWEPKPDFGFQFGSEDEFPTTIVASHEFLGSGVSLQQYVAAQTKMLRQYFKEPTIEAVNPPHIEGATDTVALEIHYPTKDGHLVYVQRIYARYAAGLGVIAFTTLKSASQQLISVFEKVLAQVSLSAD
jgi:hypothetical protein